MMFTRAGATYRIDDAGHMFVWFSWPWPLDNRGLWLFCR